MVSYQELIFNVLHSLAMLMLEAKGLDENSPFPYSYTDLLDWVVSFEDSHSSEPVRKLLEARKVTSVTHADFKPKIRMCNYYDQAFRAYYALRLDVPADRRAWEMAMLLPEKYSRTALWTCSFMIATKSSRGKSKAGFITKPATTYERFIYLVCAKMIEDTVNPGSSTSRPAKRQRTDHSETLKSFSWTRTQTQRIGFAVQMIVRGWDAYARSAGFESVDRMLAPYLQFNLVSLRPEALETRDDGYSPKAFSTQLRYMDPEAPHDTVVDGRNDQTDSDFRILAKAYISDLYTNVLRKGTYTTSPEGAWDNFRDFVVTSEKSPPPRFDKDPITSIATIKKRDLEEATAPSTPSRTPTISKTGRQPTLPRRDRPDLQSSGEQLSDQTNSSGVCPGTECSICKDARARLSTLMTPYVRIYECSFNELVGLDEMASGSESISESVQLVLTDPPFNHRRTGNRPNSEHDSISKDEMKEVIDLVNEVLRPGGHAIMFCSPSQFHEWHGLLQGDIDDEGRRTFNTDPHPMTLVNTPRHFYGRIRKKTTALHPVTSWAVHATKTGLANDDAFDLVDYSNHAFISSTHLAWTNVIDGVDRLKPGERLMRKSEAGATTALRPEQKSRALLQELICRFSKPGTVVVDMFGGTFSTAAACLTLPKHRIFVGCEMDEEAFIAAKNDLIEVFAMTILDDKTDIQFSDEETLSDARTVVEHSRVISKPRAEWEPPNGFPAFQALPPWLTQYLAAKCGYPTLSKEYGDLPVSSWPGKLIGAIHSIPLQELADVEAAHLGLCVKKSTIQHVRAEDGLFASRDIRKGDTFAHYYGCLVYENIGERQEVTKAYGLDRTLGVSPSEFEKYSMALKIAEGGVKVGDVVRSQAWVVPKMFCAASKMNDPRYADGDLEGPKVRAGILKAREANARFLSARVRAIKDLTNFAIVVVVAIADIEAGEEIFADYGADHTI